ncbi:MAG: acylneuraminate cytidylyltransferase family protein [Planctomycetota bacterium]
MRTLAVILARAGSKGLPGKNERPLAGRPCLDWTIDHALRAERADRVCLSTDGGTLAEIGVKRGVHVVRREASLASDSATVDAAARDALVRVEAEHGRFDAVVVLYANVPVRPDALVDDAIATLERTGCDSVQSYAKVGKHHPEWTAVVDGDARVRPYAGDVLNGGIHRRQDLPPAHLPDGGVIACTRAALMLELEGVQPGPHAFFGRDRRGVLTDEGAVIDIDTELDAIVAEAVLRRRAGQHAA